jgi:microcystin-dependent protein
LRSRVPLHRGSTFAFGQAGGVEMVTLYSSHLPLHNHTAYAASGVGSLSEPMNNLPAAHRDYPAFDAGAAVTMAPSAIDPGGAAQPHENMPPSCPSPSSSPSRAPSRVPDHGLSRRASTDGFR